MFSSLRIKLQSLLQPFQRRSVSISVQSKVKKISLRREHSLSKRNTFEEVQITPKKQPGENILSSLDDLCTTSKIECSLNGDMRLLNHQSKWIDLISDIGSQGSQKMLLPNSQQIGEGEGDQKTEGEKGKQTQGAIVEEIERQSAKESRSKMKKRRKESSKKRENEAITFKQKSYIDENIQSKQKLHCENKNIQKQSTLINWLQENNPQYFMITLNKASKSKQIATEIKRKRLGDYQEQRKQQNKGKYRNLCMICEDEAAIKQSINLACTHRIHKVCAQLVKWKAKMKCNLCQRRCVKDLPIANHKIRGDINAGLFMHPNNKKK